MFFELHPEKVIGYKKLSQADLGTGDSSHQTHIGLSQNTLLFLEETGAVVEDSILVYNNSVHYLDTYFEKIAVPGGGYRSPKIRIGDTRNSVVETIRRIVAHVPNNNWYLVYFGLSNGRIVFFLFDQNSSEYDYMTTIGLSFPVRGVTTIDHTDRRFLNVATYFLNKLEIADVNELMEWEITTADEIFDPRKRAHNYDIERANKLRESTGREGERLINKYLNEQVKSGELLKVTWHNENHESYYPYDFTIEDYRAFVTNIDVKTTAYSFDQKILFSSAEIRFISSTPENYSVYRVYTKDKNKYLRISDNCRSISSKINRYTNIYKKKLKEINADCESVKNAVLPDKALNFDKKEIQLTFNS